MFPFILRRAPSFYPPTDQNPTHKSTPNNTIKQGLSLNSGHYFAYVKSPAPGSHKWFQCNDAWVRQVPLNEVLNQQRGAYMVRMYKNIYIYVYA